MIKPVTLEEIVRSHVPLSSKPRAKGWYPVLCKVCSDHGRKGKRAGFRFEETSTLYNCFNCGHAALFKPEDGFLLSKEMIAVLRAFGIDANEYNIINLQQLGKDREGSKSHHDNKQEIEPTEISLPTHFYRLTNDESDTWAVIAWDYLENERGVDPTSYPFYLSTGKGPGSEEWLGRLIIPIYRNKKLIFYTGRSLTKSQKKKYLNVDVPRGNVLYGYDVLLNGKDTPIYVVEGWFDAKAIDGVAVFSNKMTTEQVAWLNRTNRQKVIIPDRTGNGKFLANQALKLGWAVSFPDVSSSCKDVADAVQLHGKLYVLDSIIINTFEGLEAEVRIKQLLK